MDDQRDRLEADMSGLTAPVEPTGAWRGALERTRAVESAKPRKTLNFGVMHVVAVAAVIVLFVGTMLPSLGKARRSARGITERERSADAPDASYAFADLDSDGVSATSIGGDPFDTDRYADPRVTPADSAVPDRSEEAPIVRHVVRKAAIDLEVEDVRAAFVHAQALISEERGEYVEDSNARDRGDGVLEADLVLRVHAQRVGEVLTELRTMGVVRHERSDADDVTDSVVDLEARLRTQRAVEEELLGLLADRPDADLDDIVRVRRELASVREQIERLEGRRQQLGQRVRLATVAVVLREAEADPAEEPAEGVWAWFKARIADAWSGGVRTLLGTVAWIVEIAIGGLIWWVIVLIASIAAWRAWRREHPKGLDERA